MIQAGLDIVVVSGGRVAVGSQGSQSLTLGFTTSPFQGLVVAI